MARFNDRIKARSCEGCKKYDTCTEPCVYLDAILSGEECVSSELPALIAYDDNIATKDYKEVLSEACVLSDVERIDKIKRIDSLYLRAVASMLVVGLPVVEIASLLKKSRTQVYRDINNGYRRKM
ncbi:hypothetical protein [Candidatus Magnetobacterium casense]|uniref:Uncharacterized protein n=1 Tax=Candidatus Magnetobacterium casense TaxID=1455061 RepID=A0ABS6S0V3_9BACT|nr:hypothetical protein [Candidatus Magnetobacterium casensis]MBV6342485.1 hypothetical protein [Candidatus Magnetobacterium casensis]